MTHQTFDMTVLGGLPVTIDASISGPDPDVGIFGYGADDWEITHINNKKCKKSPTWLYNRIDAKKGEEERIRDYINQRIDTGDRYYDEY